MKILQINKFFYIRSGASRYFFELSKLLKSHSHDISYFSMQDERNQKSDWSRYFVSNISFEKVEFRNFPRIFTRMFYSFEARRNISKLLDEYQPDIAHIHSIYHQISPSIILELKKRKIPIVQTLHDYHIISPNHTLYHDGKVCEITKKREYYKAIYHKCVKNSYMASLTEVLEQYLHYLSGVYFKNIDTFIAPSNFMTNKLLEYGIPKSKLITLYNFCDYREYEPHFESGENILFFGRLSSEKGLDFLFKVMEELPNIKLMIVGQGSMENDLKYYKKNKRLKNISLLGYKTDKELKTIIYKCKFVILPSVTYDIFPTSIMEAFASGKPVIGSRIGGIPELIKDGFNGFLFNTNDKNDCKEKINKLWKYPKTCYRFGKNARDYLETNLSPENHYKKLLNIYKKVINTYSK